MASKRDFVQKQPQKWHIHLIPIVYITSLISIQISEKYRKLCTRLASALAAATTLSVLTKKIVAGCHILLAQPHWQNNTESKPLFILLIAKHQGYSPVEPTKYYRGNNVKLVMHQISVDKIENPCY